MIYQNDDGAFVLSAKDQWKAGVYADRTAVEYANRQSHWTLAGVWERWQAKMGIPTPPIGLDQLRELTQIVRQADGNDERPPARLLHEGEEGE